MSELKTPFKIKWVHEGNIYTVENQGETNYWISWEDGGSSYYKESIHRQIDEGRIAVVTDDPVSTPEATPDVTTEGRPKKPDGAVKYEDYKWWNSEGLAWCPDHEFWYTVFVAECKSSSDKFKEIVQNVNSLNKAIDQSILLHKKYKTSVDFLNIVKDIQVERGAEYEQEEGERSFEKIATVFNVYRGKDLLPSDIALILEIMKNVRFYAQDRYHLDSVIDKVSYGSLWAELVTQERA